MKIAKININLFKQSVIKNIAQKTIKQKTVTTLPFVATPIVLYNLRGARNSLLETYKNNAINEQKQLLNNDKISRTTYNDRVEDIRQYLNKHNKKYKEVKDKIHKIMDRNINIQKLLDETHLEDGLSARECKDLSQVIVLYNNLQDILEKEIYFKGVMNAYYYFKRIGIID